MGGNTLPNAPDVLAGVASIILTELADHPDRNVWVTETAFLCEDGSHCIFLYKKGNRALDPHAFNLSCPKLNQSYSGISAISLENGFNTKDVMLISPLEYTETVNTRWQ
ncbi:hypothetical protein B0H11DRAFT_1920305 [Mycena galericulata]|nr:hypothetical protein B0H11DRAFT_1920305 [Mycena galericulata]